MARWSESRGTTLVLTHPRGPDRYARVALVSKRTLFGEAHNVREARAEDATRSGREPEALGFGRMLSWRWLGQSEADQLLAARLRTLETLGYAVLGGSDDSDGSAASRGPWDWLRDLVQRQLARPADDASDAHVDAADSTDDDRDHERVGARLRETLDRLGLEPDAVMEGLASILELDEAELRAPTLATARALEPALLAMLLPLWFGHDSPGLRAVGQRWLALPTTLYEIEPSQVERWAASSGPLTDALREPIEREGLALLGPEALGRLARTATDPRIKAATGAWRARLN